MKRLGKCRCKKNQYPSYRVLQYKCWHPDGEYWVEPRTKSLIKCFTCGNSWLSDAKYVDILTQHWFCETYNPKSHNAFQNRYTRSKYDQ